MYMGTVRSFFCPCGFCSRPENMQFRRLIRLGLGRSVSEMPIEMEDELDDDEVFTQTTRTQQRYRQVRKYRPVTLATGSLVDRRLVHANGSREPARRAHYSLR